MSIQWIVTLNGALQEGRHPAAWLAAPTDRHDPVLLAAFTLLDLALRPPGTANVRVLARRARA